MTAHQQSPDIRAGRTMRIMSRYYRVLIGLVCAVVIMAACSSTESDPDLEVVDVTASEASSAAGADDNAIKVDCIFRNNASDRAVDTWARLRKDDAVWLQEQTISLAKDHEQSVSFVFPGSTLPEADVSAFETECGFGKASFVVE